MAVIKTIRHVRQKIGGRFLEKRGLTHQQNNKESGEWAVMSHKHLARRVVQDALRSIESSSFLDDPCDDQSHGVKKDINANDDATSNVSPLHLTRGDFFLQDRPSLKATNRDVLIGSDEFKSKSKSNQRHPGNQMYQKTLGRFLSETRSAHRQNQKKKLSLFPSSRDVLCCEDLPDDNTQKGNELFRSLLSSLSETYEASKCGNEKAAIARRVLSQVWGRGGRFLVQTTTNNEAAKGWNELAEIDALIEVRRAFLREKECFSCEL